MSLKSDHELKVETAQVLADQITSLRQCEGFQKWLLPKLEKLRDDLTARMRDGHCASFDDYQATVKLLSDLETAIFNPLANDLKRHHGVLADAAK